MNSVLTKYAAAGIQFAIVLVAALAQLTGKITLVDALQLIPLAVNAFTVYFARLFGTSMRSGWKTAAAVIGALAAAAIPFATVHHITGAQIAIVILAGLQVLGAHVGVQIRSDAASLTGGLAATGSDFDDAVTPTAMVKTVTTEDGVEAGAGR